MKYPTVVFDLDGTLLDSLQDIANSANDVLVQIGHEPHPIAAYSTLVGDGVRVLFERALGVDSISAADKLDDCMRRFNLVYETRCTEASQLYPGIKELVIELHARKLQLAVLSNKPDKFTKRLVDHYFPSREFSIVLGQREGIPRKPDPAGVFEIAKALETPADCIAYVGDTNTDMLTAQNAGCFAIGVTWGFRSREELLSCGAAALADNTQDLLKLITSG